MRGIGIIALKQVIQGLRDSQTMLIMVAMPLLFLGVLNMVFTSQAASNMQRDKVVIRYHLEGEEVMTQHAQALIDQLKTVYTRVEPFEAASYDKTGDLIVSFKDMKHIRIYYDQCLRDEVQILQVVLKNMMGQHRTRGQFPYTSSDEGRGSQVPAEVRSLQYMQVGESEKQAMMSYYGVTMTTLTILFASVSGAYSMIKEREAATLYKLRSMPCRIMTILTGKLLGSALVVLLQIIVIMYLIEKGFKIKWGEYKGLVLIVLWSEGIFAIALGMCLGTWLRDNKSAWLILLLVIMVAGFLAGAFIPLGSMERLDAYGYTQWSPLTRINEALFGLIYSLQMQEAYRVIGLHLILGAGLLGATSYRVEVRV